MQSVPTPVPVRLPSEGEEQSECSPKGFLAASEAEI